MNETTETETETREANGSKTEATAPRVGVQPQFYQTPEPLSASRHAGLGLRSGADFGFARQASSVMLTASEFPLASRTYPIVFTNTEEPMPVAVTGVRAGENLFVADGVWEARAYVPAFVRRYPFAFVENEDKSRLVLCIDTSADAVSASGESRFFEGGETTELTKKALDFCTSFQSQHNLTRELGRTLKSHDLLVQRQAELTLPNGQTSAVRDFLTVDEEKLNALEDGPFLELRRRGLLPFLYFQIMSLSNFRDLAARCSA